MNNLTLVSVVPEEQGGGSDLTCVPVQWDVGFPVRQHSGHRVSHGRLRPHVEVGVVGELEGQHVGGMVHQDVLPHVRGLGVVPAGPRGAAVSEQSRPDQTT